MSDWTPIRPDRAAAMLREVQRGLAEGHTTWAAEGVGWIAAELEVDAAMIELFQTRNERGSEYVRQ